MPRTNAADQPETTQPQTETRELTPLQRRYLDQLAQEQGRQGEEALNLVAADLGIVPAEGWRWNPPLMRFERPVQPPPPAP